MTETTPAETTNLDRYGSPELDWHRARSALAADPTAEVTYFLGTCRPDGTPHAAGVGAQWLDGDLYFTSNPRARKARDLASNPVCTISVRMPGIDLVLDGSAQRVTDPDVLERAAAGYRAGGWPAEVQGDALTAPFSAPSAGPPPWHLYRFVFHTVVGVATSEPSGATRWRFER
ncbi:pyridoxamine 5'-phosphate oxidase family protein [Amycolatopsis acidiphila]|uniref:Pyridoxamine 5'-phosphate oxidase family protein n=1 Tax=Amycolatopsis acidiphila TaxID=715473 RepID=A0A558AFB0_9PSEU|nr:pyridoxamine 5'-phosphate oxidase family protein [Amycolatopsis acidiphila]TVT22955.1 pyridoxamine 5'-phosphate oxidase family protein [Amycolatopsis acidiphila]UIJ57115.1 pyridoxamine 5'-phosphate oxidase family protein [Amycolatopsis acidiphila]GHG53279.1 pyridoxamine 5'-phosphate oxidase [Amycolatopsis acidiphila]